MERLNRLYDCYPRAMTAAAWIAVVVFTVAAWWAIIYYAYPALTRGS